MDEERQGLAAAREGVGVGALADPPPDRFVAIAGSWSRPRASLAAEEHATWGINLARLATRRTPPQDVRAALGLPPSVWFGLFLSGSPETCSQFWDGDRGALLDWASEQSLSFVQSLSTPIVARALRVYEEITDRGLTSGIDWPINATDADDRRIADFVRDRSVPAIVISRGVTYGLPKYQKRRMVRMKQIASLIDTPKTVFVLGPSEPRTAAMTAAFFKGHEIVFGNTKAWVQAGRWSIQPYQDVSRDKWTQAEVYRESLRRWRKWGDAIARSRRG